MFMILMSINLILVLAGIILGGDYTLYLILPGLLMICWAQFNIKTTVAKWEKVPTDMTGKEVAEKILSDYGISDVFVEHTQGSLSDHYDPTVKIVRLSDSTYNETSVSAIAIAAHEVGHAIQHHLAYKPLMMRNSVAPVVGLVSSAWSFLIIAGIFFSIPNLIHIGIVCLSVFLAFSIITLPVEFDASKRAVVALEEAAYLGPNELTGAKKVLNAAAMTYVASTLMTLLQLIRLLMLLNRNND